MRFLLILLVLFVVIFSLAKSAWTGNDSPKRFSIVYDQAEGLNIMRIIQDSNTGAQYLYYKYGNGASMVKIAEGSNITKAQ